LNGKEDAGQEGSIETPRRWEGPVALVLSCFCAWIIQLATQLTGPGLELPNHSDFNCVGNAVGPDARFEVFFGKLDWQSMIVLEGVAALFAVALAALVLKGVWIRKDAAYQRVLTVLFAIGAGLLLVDILDISSMWKPETSAGAVAWLQARIPWAAGPLSLLQHAGFLSLLLHTLPTGCGAVRAEVVWGRMIGEPAGLAIGVALFAAITLPLATTPSELAKRSRHLGQLLYAASVLFVIGLLMTRANLSWILAQWDWPNLDFPPDTRKEIVERGVKLAGVAYSAILAVFYLPARWILQNHIDKAVPKGKRTLGTQAREGWLKENGFSAGWRDDIKQILAVLAPVLAAPVFETLAK
jgi:hypothetical protein